MGEAVQFLSLFFYVKIKNDIKIKKVESHSYNSTLLEIMKKKSFRIVYNIIV